MKWLTHRFLISIFFVGASLFSSQAFSATTFNILDFRLNELMAFQPGITTATGAVGVGNTFSGELSWNPYVGITPEMGVRGNIGGTLLLGTGSSLFFAMEYQALFSYAVNQNFIIEGGLGAQSWFSYAPATYLVASANGMYRFTNKLFGMINGIFFGYSPLFASPLCHQIKVGVQFSF